MTDIRTRVAKRSKQNAICRAFHAKSDSQTIASWNMNLNRILLIFNVSSVVSVRPVLTVHSQTELGLTIRAVVTDTYIVVSDTHTAVTNTHAVVSDIHTVITDTHAVATDTHTIVSEVRQDFAKTNAMLSDISRKVLGSQEGDDDQRPLVSDTRTRAVPIPKYMLTAAQSQIRSATLTPHRSSNLYLHLAYLVNHLHRRRGPVSDVMG